MTTPFVKLEIVTDPVVEVAACVKVHPLLLFIEVTDEYPSSGEVVIKLQLRLAEAVLKASTAPAMLLTELEDFR